MSELVHIPRRALYDATETCELLSLSKREIHELIRSNRLLTVQQGRRRLVPAGSIDLYVELLVHEAGGDDRGDAA